MIQIEAEILKIGLANSFFFLTNHEKLNSNSGPEFYLGQQVDRQIQ